MTNVENRLTRRAALSAAGATALVLSLGERAVFGLKDGKIVDFIDFQLA